MNLLVTMRVDVVEKYNERRDAIDQRWMDFINYSGFNPILAPNHTESIVSILEKNHVNGLLLTGGNSLMKYGGDAPERDATEHYLLEYFTCKNLPVLGVCRGMQVIQDFYNNKLEKVNGHVGTRSQLCIDGNVKFRSLLESYHEVNSYHTIGSSCTAEPLQTIARSPDGIVKALCHKSKKVYGIMWHVEREYSFNPLDKELFYQIFAN